MTGRDGAGIVPDLAAADRDSAFTIVPIDSAGNEHQDSGSFAHGRACVTTRFCEEAFGESFNGDRELCFALMILVRWPPVSSCWATRRSVRDGPEQGDMSSRSTLRPSTLTTPLPRL